MKRTSASDRSLSVAIMATTPTGSARSNTTPRLAELVATFPVSRLIVVINSSNSPRKKEIPIQEHLNIRPLVEFLPVFDENASCVSNCLRNLVINTFLFPTPAHERCVVRRPSSTAYRAALTFPSEMTVLTLPSFMGSKWSKPGSYEAKPLTQMRGTYSAMPIMIFNAFA